MGHANTPPAIPEIRDEAGESPKWLPGLGVAIFALLLVWVLWGADVIGDGPAERAPLFGGSAQPSHGHGDDHAGHGHGDDHAGHGHGDDHAGHGH